MQSYLAEVIHGLARPLQEGVDVAPLQVDAPEGSIGVVVGGEFQERAAAGSAKVGLYRLIAAAGLSPLFSAEVMAEVQHWQQSPGIDDEALEDWRMEPFVTIDGASSKDLDQAVCVLASGEGYVVHYALADASYYAPQGSALWESALSRGASYYLPGLMVPMLPRALSEDLVSLNPGVDRRALLLSMHLDGKGQCTETKLRRVRIQSRGKLAFNAVQAFYDGERSTMGLGAAVDANLRHLKSVGELRMGLAEARSIVRYRRSEVSAKLGQSGLRFEVKTEARKNIERYNEQVSLLCNVEGAKLLRERAEAVGPEVDAIYRVHPAPTKEKVAGFEAMLEELVTAQDLPANWLWKATGEVPLADYLRNLPEKGRSGRIARAVHRQAVMMNVRSSFARTPESHHGVGAEVYGRFSAPMREAVGVFLHQELLEAVSGNTDADAELCQAVIAKANDARLLQKKLTRDGQRLVLDQLFSEARQGSRSLVGTLMGLTSSKAHVLLDDPAVDVKVYLRDMPELKRRDDVSLEVDGLALRVGDPVRLVVEGQDLERNRWKLVLRKG